jgi:hypothetical protein
MKLIHSYFKITAEWRSGEWIIESGEVRVEKLSVFSF